MNVIKREQNDAYKAFGIVLGTIVLSMLGIINTTLIQMYLPL